MKRFSILIAALCLCLTGCGKQTTEATAQIFAMDTVMGLRACGGETEAALAVAEDEIYRLDEALSRTREDSAVSRLNSAAGGTPVESSNVGKEGTYVAASMARCSRLITRMPSSVVSSTSTPQGTCTQSAARAAVITRVSRGR